LNYTYRGLWGTLISVAVLFLASSFTSAPAGANIRGLTVDWKAPMEPFQGLSDWRLSLGVSVLLTVGIYAWLW
jgi:hypothetical protein